MDDLIQCIKDRYTPTELVEKLDISMDDLIYDLYNYIETNINLFEDELKEFFYNND